MDLFWVIWIILKSAVVTDVVLLCGRGLQLLSTWLFTSGTENWSAGVVRTLSEVFAIITFVSLVIRDFCTYFFRRRE